MMIKNLHDSAEFAMAAYALLVRGQTEDQIENLKAQGFSQRQAEEFADRYPTVVTQFSDAETSFSATVFADESGNITVAFRGTAEFGDVVATDVDMAGHNQIPAMYNWWRRVTLAWFLDSLERTSVVHWNAGPAGTLAAA